MSAGAGDDQALVLASSVLHTCVSVRDSTFDIPLDIPLCSSLISAFDSMGLLSILKKLKEKEKEVRLLML